MDNRYFCVHVECVLTDDDKFELEHSLNSQQSGFWGYASKTACHPNNNFCILISGPVKLENNYFEALTSALSNLNQNLFVSNFYMHNRLNANDKVEMILPEWSFYRFLSRDYLGAVIALRTTSELEKNQYSVNRELVTRMILEKNLIPHKLNKFGYVQTGAETPIPISHRINMIQDAKCLPTGTEIGDSALGAVHLGFAKFAPRKVSIVIPTAGKSLDKEEIPCVVNAIKSISEQELGDTEVEIIVVYDECADLNYLENIKKLNLNCEIKLLPFSEEFNFSKKCNLGAEVADGDVVIFLNDDTKWITKNGIVELAGLAMQEEIGAVGAKLYFADNRIQHAGIITVEANLRHAYFKSDLPIGFFGDVTSIHEVTGVTGACVAQRKEIWEKVGKWNEQLPNSYNDVDYNFKINSAGFKIIQNNYVELFHFESVSREAFVSDFEFRYMRSKWFKLLTLDGYMPNAALTESEIIKNSSRLLTRIIQARSIYSHYGFLALVKRISRFIRKKLNFL